MEVIVIRKLLTLACLAGLFVACGNDSSSAPEVVESSSSEVVESSSSEQLESSSSSEKRLSSSEESSSSVYAEKHLAWNYLNPALSYGEVTDERDGRVYKYVELDGYIRFMAENLNYADSVANSNLLGSSWCPNNDLDSCSKYGRLYTWAAAMNVDPKYNYEEFTGKKGVPMNVEYQGLCPEGWFVYADKWVWQEYVWKIQAVDYCAQEGWRYEGCTNAIGFSALPGGYYENGEFKDVGEKFYYWSVQGGGKDLGGRGCLYVSTGDFGISFGRNINFKAEKTQGAAVRCYQLIPQDPCDDPDNPYCSSSSEAAGESSSSDAVEESSSSDAVESSSSETFGVDENNDEAPL